MSNTEIQGKVDTQKKNDTRELVLQYLAFFKSKTNEFESLRGLLAPSFKFQSPLGNFDNADAFIADLTRDALCIERIEARRLLIDGNSACALYDLTSRNPEIGTLTITEWYECQDGRITCVLSTHDASAMRPILSRI